MLARRLYYHAKPYLPRAIRIAFRQWHAARVLRRSAAIWPINPAAGVKPNGWPGWPDGKDFAFVLTHDVESQCGVERVRPLAELEMTLGFRSSFNFIPEGDYAVPSELREWLIGNDFEVGVHDLYHDGHLFSSHAGFQEKAARINHHLRAWNACGFRSGYMLRNLEWIQKLDIRYDASTFDTDPFEPQPDGAGTIFPFHVPRGREANESGCSPSEKRDGGYVELPYTLAQDSTLFILLKETTDEIWRKKIQWIVERGGMALMNTHPDYMRFDDRPDSRTFSVSLYREFLEYVRAEYTGRIWHALPREVAELCLSEESGLC